MTIENDRRRVQVTELTLPKINDALRQLTDMVCRLEGRSGFVNLRDSIKLQTNEQTLMDFSTSTSGNAAIVAFGTENSSIALAKGARLETDGDWIATDTVASIFALNRAGDLTLYANTGLTVGQAFTPTLVLTLGSTGSVAQHALVSATHTASNLTIGDLLTATGATTFAFQGVDNLTELASEPDQLSDYFLLFDNSAVVAGGTGQNVKIKPKYISGNMPFAALFSNGQVFTTTGANLTSYDYTFPAGDLTAGDVIRIHGRANLTGTTAGTKSLTIALGTGTATTVFTATTTTNPTFFEFECTIYIRSTTSAGLHLRSQWGSAGATPANTFWNGAGWTLSDISANSQLVRLVGTHTGSNTEMKMADYSIRVFRGGGNAVVV